TEDLRRSGERFYFRGLRIHDILRFLLAAVRIVAPSARLFLPFWAYANFSHCFLLADLPVFSDQLSPGTPGCAVPRCCGRGEPRPRIYDELGHCPWSSTASSVS